MTPSPYHRFRDEAAVAAEWQARLQAMKLRRARLSYRDISVVMEEYHGVRRSEGAWKIVLRQMGAPPEPRGRPFDGSKA